MAVFSVKNEKMSEEEIREHKLRKADFIWWCDNAAKFFVEENRGKHVAVVNKETFFGNTYDEADEKARAKYPHRRFIVHYIPSDWSKRI